MPVLLFIPAPGVAAWDQGPSEMLLHGTASRSTDTVMPVRGVTQQISACLAGTGEIPFDKGKQRTQHIIETWLNGENCLPA